MVSLFDSMERTDCGPRPYGEPDFTYLNRSARPGVEAIRHALDAWFSRYPDEHRPDMAGRLKSSDNLQHRAAFFELFLHELL